MMMRVKLATWPDRVFPTRSSLVLLECLVTQEQESVIVAWGSQSRPNGKLSPTFRRHFPQQKLNLHYCAPSLPVKSTPYSATEIERL